MKTVGLTGGIGSGKSTVASVFGAMGFPCYDSDSAMKRLYVEDRSLHREMAACFGADTYLPDGRLNSTYLSDILFRDATAQARLERVAYPRLAADFADWNRRQSAPFTLFESALLLQTRLDIPFVKILAVVAPADIRMESVRQRSGLSTEEILRRMARQGDDSTWRERADFVIVNDRVTPLMPQILTFIHSLNL